MPDAPRPGGCVIQFRGGLHYGAERDAAADRTPAARRRAAQPDRAGARARSPPERQVPLQPHPDTPLEALLAPLDYDEAAHARAHEAFFADLRERLPALPDRGEPGPGAARLLEVLGERERVAHKALRAYWQENLQALAEANLQAGHAFTILHRHAALIDALHRFAFELTLEELPWLLQLQIAEGEQELRFNQELLPKKEDKLRHFREQLPAILEAEGGAAEHRDYYEQVAGTLAREAEQCREQVEALQETLPSLRAFPLEAGFVHRRLVLFARGGYGRAELSFDSDLDTGYCLDTAGLAAGDVAIFRELILHMEGMLRGAGLQTVHQYFELDEPLERFAEPETLHTIPSILESRPLAGNATVLERLQRRFREVLPFERYAKKKVEEFEAQPEPGLTDMDLKEDRGGLRTVQIPLWLLGITRGATRFDTAALLRLAHREGLLSPWEAARLVRSLELLYDLRNFVGAAERHYDTREARDTLQGAPAFAPHRINDPLTRLYLFHKPRFASIDDLDAYRLRLLDATQRVGAALLGRVLDRTVHEVEGELRIAVHLGTKCVTGVAAAGSETVEPGTLPSLLAEGTVLLDLFAYLGATGYALSPALRDALSGLVPRVAPARGGEAQAAQAARFSRIMGSPYAHQAVATMYEVNSPWDPELAPLLGRYLPACGRLHYLLRQGAGTVVPLHAVVIDSLRRGQALLTWLRQAYPEWHQLLRPAHVEALKWSLLLHSLDRSESVEPDPARSAELAAEALERLGLRDEALGQRVRHLVQHQQALVSLMRTATYIDQALAQYFELAGRNIVNGVLLFLVNRAILEAQPHHARMEVDNLVRLFDETARILAEMRGFPTEAQSLELINRYLDQKKSELEADTRLHLLVNKALVQGLEQAVYAPLAAHDEKRWRRMQAKVDDLDALHREILLGKHRERRQERLVQRLMQSLKRFLSPETLQALTREEEEVFQWMFASFPNRYLMRTSPGQLAREMVKFTGFRTARVLADFIMGRDGAVEGLLICTRGVPRSHIRVAYGLSLKQVNILAGKINRVDYGEGVVGYCYYFEVSGLSPEAELHPRDLEAVIRGETPPDLELAPGSHPAQRGTRVEFLDDDGKGYEVVRRDGGYERRGRPLRRVQVVRRDAPFLFYKVCQVFDRFGVPIEQALITTTGNQVVDYFYLDPADARHLEASRFEETLISLLDASPLAV